MLEFKLKIAIIADIHGNSLALDGVLADIQSAGGVDEYWFLGDYAAIGPDPIGVLERISELPNARFIRGNTDRYIVTGDISWLDFEDTNADLDLFIHVSRSFAWTTGAVAASGWLPWLEELPLDMNRRLPDGSRVLVVHAAPGTDDSMGVSYNISDEELTKLVSGIEVDLVIVGHTHIPFDRSVGEVRVVNPGSLSNPFPPDLRASYAILQADESGYEITLRRADYDREAFIHAVRQVNHPAADYIIRFMRGENKKDWME
jgi:putative phosphoesterase